MKRILLVDDSIDFLKILAQALERDFEVHTATGVSEAMAIIGEIEMDSICSDLEMKDGTGLDISKTSSDFLTQIKNNCDRSN